MNLILYVMKDVQKHLILLAIMNIYVLINLQKMVIILIQLNYCIKNVIIFVKNVIQEVLKQIIIVLNVNQGFIF